MVDIDHKDTVRNNNKWDNLREANKSESAKNRAVRSDSVLGVKGIRYAGNRYLASITDGGIRLHLGSYTTLEEAQKAIQNKRIDLHGEFANDG